MENQDTNGTEESVYISEVSLFQGFVELHARTVIGKRKGVLIREVSSFQECP